MLSHPILHISIKLPSGIRLWEQHNQQQQQRRLTLSEAKFGAGAAQDLGLFPCRAGPSSISPLSSDCGRESQSCACVLPPGDASGTDSRALTAKSRSRRAVIVAMRSSRVRFSAFSWYKQLSNDATETQTARLWGNRHAAFHFHDGHRLPGDRSALPHIWLGTHCRLLC